ncbi:MAG: hypothetical protein ABR595_10250 [Psychroflexus sp.]
MMKNFKKIIVVLLLIVWSPNHAASELNRVAESTDGYVVNDCSFEEIKLVSDMLYFIDIPINGSIRIGDCTMTYNIRVSFSILDKEVTRVRGNLTFSGSCSGSVDFDIDLTSNSDGTINELPIFDGVDIDNPYDFEQFLVREINQAIINN